MRKMVTGWVTVPVTIQVTTSIRIHTSYAVVDLLATQVAKDLFSSMLLVVLRVYTNCVLMLKR